ncbi:MAG: CHASE domain-containing protein, partial [Wenzhouxiangella sp.]|nr:CHASE domain-containing protein [Wenzhouxiangella sp.]
MPGLSVQRQRFQVGLAAILSLVVAGGTAFGVVKLSQINQQAQQQVLESQADQILNLLESRFLLHKTRIQAAAALFTSSTAVSRAEWKQFVETSAATSNDMFEMFWAERVAADALPALRRRMEAAGFEGFSPDPPGARDVYCPIVYTEPLDIHRDSLGLDVCARPKSNPAAQRARDTGIPQVSAPIELTADANAP